MKFVLKKIAGLIIALLIVSVLAFLAFEVIPGDPARSIPVSYTHLVFGNYRPGIRICQDREGGQFLRDAGLHAGSGAWDHDNVYNKDSARMVLCRADL